MTIDFLGIEVRLRRGTIVILAVVLAAAVFAGVMISQNNEGIIIDAADDNTETDYKNGIANMTENSPPAKEDIPEVQIKVYVVGCVNNPGIVTLKKGQMIHDAIEAAGGATEDAAIDKINMVYELKVNVMLHVLSKDETKPNSVNSPTGAGASIISDDGGAVQGVKSGAGGVNGKVNINTATAEELDTLPGVGEKTADDIILYRQKKGAFKKIEEIMNVTRIGQGRFDNMKDFITVGD